MKNKSCPVCAVIKQTWQMKERHMSGHVTLWGSGAEDKWSVGSVVWFLSSFQTEISFWGRSDWGRVSRIVSPPPRNVYYHNSTFTSSLLDLLLMLEGSTSVKHRERCAAPTIILQQLVAHHSNCQASKNKTNKQKLYGDQIFLWLRSTESSEEKRKRKLYNDQGYM